jgi:hypothetical protein
MDGVKVITRADIKERTAEWDAEDAKREAEASTKHDLGGGRPDALKRGACRTACTSPWVSSL